MGGGGGGGGACCVTPDLSCDQGGCRNKRRAKEIKGMGNKRRKPSLFLLVFYLSDLEVRFAVQGLCFDVADAGLRLRVGLVRPHHLRADRPANRQDQPQHQPGSVVATRTPSKPPTPPSPTTTKRTTPTKNKNGSVIEETATATATQQPQRHQN